MSWHLRGFGTSPDPRTVGPRLCVGFALGLVAILVTACGTEPEAPGMAEPSLPHVHALVTNPADGSLLAGTHEGVVRIEDGKAIPVGSSRQDTMGLAVTGPDNFLASGHPEQGVAGPPHLGLITSADGAETWSSVSLAGEADFHTLVPTTAGLYGYNSITSTLMFSKDNKTWTKLLTADLYDVAANPNDPTHLLMTTDAGLQNLRVGDSPTTLPNTKGLALIEWADKQDVVGLTVTGEVKLSTDGGHTWTRQGAVRGDIEALGIGQDAWHVATTDGVFTSTDSGKTWNRILGDAP